jgi:hypothetical protein
MADNKCPYCGSKEIGEDNGQWFCMGCGWEVPAPVATDEPEVIDENKKHRIWLRVGMSVQLSVAELRRLDNGDASVVRDAIKGGLGELDGDSYIPDEIWDDEQYKEIPEELKHEIGFDL